MTGRGNQRNRGLQTGEGSKSARVDWTHMTSALSVSATRVPRAIARKPVSTADYGRVAWSMDGTGSRDRHRRRVDAARLAKGVLSRLGAIDGPAQDGC